MCTCYHPVSNLFAICHLIPDISGYAPFYLHYIECLKKSVVTQFAVSFVSHECLKKKDFRRGVRMNNKRKLTHLLLKHALPIPPIYICTLKCLILKNGIFGSTSFTFR